MRNGASYADSGTHYADDGAQKRPSRGMGEIISLAEYARALFAGNLVILTSRKLSSAVAELAFASERGAWGVLDNRRLISNRLYRRLFHYWGAGLSDRRAEVYAAAYRPGSDVSRARDSASSMIEGDTWRACRSAVTAEAGSQDS